MSDLYFPTLPGLVFRSRTLVYNETVQEAVSGAEYRIKNWTGPKYRFVYDVKMRTGTAPSEADTLIDFVKAHSGPHESFLVVDLRDGETRRVRFSDVEIEEERLAGGLYQVGSLELITTNAQPGDTVPPLTLVSPDDSVWDITIDNDGSIVTTKE